ncbi:hypothetical protein [Gordonia polyisoprenivorans]|uniref:hypothetical protein n=1 Tax=Gordonia polyisoprenivorans TaxID=84595 RepID=UPI001F0A4629|nr:hypothetical protein [Gordonia polyisoprenivorans]
MVGEFDGMIKYGRLRRPGESIADAVIREKLREDEIRDTGPRVVRWTWNDLERDAFIPRLHRRLAPLDLVAACLLTTLPLVDFVPAQRIRHAGTKQFSGKPQPSSSKLVIAGAGGRVTIAPA